MTSAAAPPPSGPKNRKIQKRADALRENLMKRKQQARARGGNKTEQEKD